MLVVDVAVGSVQAGDIDSYGRVIAQTPQLTQPPYPNSNPNIEWFVYYVEGDAEPKYEAATREKGHFPLCSLKPKTLTVNQVAYVHEQVRIHPIAKGDFQSELIDSGLLESIMERLYSHSGKTLKAVLDNELAYRGP
jgi:hypothetical protein